MSGRRGRARFGRGRNCVPRCLPLAPGEVDRLPGRRRRAGFGHLQSSPLVVVVQLSERVELDGLIHGGPVHCVEHVGGDGEAAAGDLLGVPLGPAYACSGISRERGRRFFLHVMPELPIHADGLGLAGRCLWAQRLVDFF